MFKKATKEQAKLRMALIGPSGSGKTMSALKIASGLGQRIAVIDTEHGSASKYADQFEFDVCELVSFHPREYINAISQAVAAGYDVLVIDSLSHAWMGKDGALELVDKAAKKSQSGNTFSAWRDITPLHNQLVDAIIACRCHVIATMRSKIEYVMETNERGKTVPRKVGLAPVQKSEMEYEFDVVGEMSIDNSMIVTKSRCPVLSGEVFEKPGDDVASMLKAWLTDGAVPVERVSKSTLIQQTTAEMERLGWENKKGAAYVKENYGKAKRDEMTVDELQEFLAYLQVQPNPENVTVGGMIL